MSVQISSQLGVCQRCGSSDVCFTGAYKANAQSMPHKTYQRKSSLYFMGDPFTAIYILRSGSAKSFINTAEGNEQISKFYFSGDMIGLEGFDNMIHTQSVSFLETSSVCRISLPEFNRAMSESHEVRQRLLKSMSHSIIDEQLLLMSMTQYSSEQRLLKFLLDLSARFKQSGLSEQIFHLTMTRIDIANFLGLAIETISRLLTKMDSQGLIKVNNRQITLCDISHLRRCLVKQVA